MSSSQDVSPAGAGAALEVRRCVACCEPIRAGARVCSHCRSSQRSPRWAAFATAAKWVATAAALGAVLSTAQQLGSIAREAGERGDAVADLVAAARLGSAAGDFESAWQLLEEALGIERGSALARQAQVDVALPWARHASSSRKLDESQLQDLTARLLPVLQRAAAAPRGRRAADALAHVGLLNVLRTRWLGDFEVDPWFEKALARDAGNGFANVMFAQWMLDPQNPRDYGAGKLATALTYFTRALETGDDPVAVVEARRNALLRADDVLARLELVHLLDGARKAGEVVDGNRRKDLLLAFFWLALEPERETLFARLTAQVPAADVVATWLWLRAGTGYDDYPFNSAEHYLTSRFVSARLHEAAGEVEPALALYEEVVTVRSMYAHDELKRAAKLAAQRLANR